MKAFKMDLKGFGDLQNYTTLKLLLDDTLLHVCFGDLQNYTTLKLFVWFPFILTSFGDLQNYTTLKPSLLTYS